MKLAASECKEVWQTFHIALRNFTPWVGNKINLFMILTWKYNTNNIVVHTGVRTIASEKNCSPDNYPADNCPLDDSPRIIALRTIAPEEYWPGKIAPPENCLPDNCPRGILAPGNYILHNWPGLLLPKKNSKGNCPLTISPWKLSSRKITFQMICCLHNYPSDK